MRYTRSNKRRWLFSAIGRLRAVTSGENLHQTPIGHFQSFDVTSYLVDNLRGVAIEVRFRRRPL